MYEHEKSDSPVVPAKPPNNTAQAVAEVVEGRGLAEENTTSKTRSGHRSGSGASNALARVREVARRDKEARFTALLHHVTVDRLRSAFWAIRPGAAPGVDGVTWANFVDAIINTCLQLMLQQHVKQLLATINGVQGPATGETSD
jgi:hypothetical protein